MMIFVWLLFGVLVYYLVTGKGTNDILGRNSKSAEDILRERFVKGEINEETYKKMMQTLK